MSENNKNGAKAAGETNAAQRTHKEGKPAARRGRPPKKEKAAALKEAAVEKKEVAAPQESAAQNNGAAAEAAGKTPKRRGRRSNKAKEAKKVPLKIISLGGLGEIGKNITAYESGNDIVVVDCGMAFPDEDLLGVDLVIPDFTYLERNRDKIRGIVITHGHEDHIGSLPYLLKSIKIPVFGTRLTIGLIEGKLKEHGLLGKVSLNVVQPRDIIKMGCMDVEFIRVNHSIPDSCAVAIHAPAGVVIQTGDFKIDYTPIEGEIIDLARFGELGSHGVLALLADSTNAERPGSTMSERTVGESFDKLFKSAVGRRIIIATFASNIHRVQQIIDAAVKDGRKVAISGRSMENVVAKAIELGYLTVKEETLIDLDMLNRYTDDKVVVITTGSQGEPMSALTRMARSDHRKLSVTPNDFIIISATPIPGNEKTVGRVVNDLMKLGAEVIYEKMYEVHVSGHACQDELRLMLGLTRPKFFIPVHGEYKHLKKHSDLARSMGMNPKNIFISDIGRVLETDGETMNFTGMVPAGRVLVDGLGVGDVGSIVLRDRKHLAEDGLIVVVMAMDASTGELLSGPDLVSRGFVYVRESEAMMNEARDIARSAIERCQQNGSRDWSTIKQKVRDDLSDFLYSRTKRRPMILPVIQEV